MSTIILSLFALLIVAVAYGYPVRKRYEEVAMLIECNEQDDPMASAHGDVSHVAPWVKRRPF